MPKSIPPAIKTAMLDTLRQVKCGKLTIVQAGEKLTHLNFHPDFPAVTDPRLRTVIEDIAPDLEIEDGNTWDARRFWSSIETLLDEVFEASASGNDRL